MVIKAAAPVVDYDGNLLGVLYGGNLINRSYKIVDKIKETVFQKGVYKGKDLGTATIFQGDLRISTNVQTQDGKRAIGTRVSEEVYNQVMVKGEPWIERAFVVKEWRITAYEPIKDISGNIIGILYVGILEDKFTDMEKEAVWWLVSITILGAIVTMAVAYLLAYSITGPLSRLSNAAHQLAQGDMNQEIKVKSEDEIGELGKAFNYMISAIKERDEKLKAETQQALIHMEKMSSLGQMAAGVAHEINNPLSGVLTYIQLMLKNIRANKAISPEELDKKLSTMEKEIDRCTKIIRSLLDFARQTKPSIRPIDLIRVIENSLVMLAHQAELSNVRIVKEFQGKSCQIEADADQLQQVFTNMILNAIQAMTTGGTLTISISHDTAKGEIGVKFQDTGLGITPENLKKLFTPFFTTKEKGKGIGLGLAVCYGIIQRHGGDIKVDSEVGKGTIFTIWLREKHTA
jgi:two-component system NtrC family sensor kinase